MKIFFTINILVISVSVYANCTDLLRLEVAKRLGKEKFLFSNEFVERKNSKISEFESSLFRFEDFEKNPSLSSTKDMNFLRAYAAGVIPSKFMKAIFKLRIDVNSVESYKEWLYELYNDIAVNIYLSKDIDAIKKFETKGKVAKNIVITSILERSIKGGFSGNEQDIEIVGDVLEDYEFGDILIQKKYIYDYHQQYSPHGDLIHFFNLDFIIFSLIKNNEPVEIASELYQWMGQFIDVEYGDKNQYKFNVLSDVWGEFFDSTGLSLSSPELLNFILLNFFGIDYLEIPEFSMKQGYN